MAESSQPVALRAYLDNLVHHVDSFGEDELLTAYFQMQSYDELRRFTQQYEEQFIAASYRRDIPMLTGIVKKIEASFTAGLSQEVVQVSSQKERALPVYDVGEDELMTHAHETLQSMKDVAPLAQTVSKSGKTTNSEFISKLVDRYIEHSKEISKEERTAFLNAIDQKSESQPHTPAEQILQRAVEETLPPESRSARSMVKNKELVDRIGDLQQSAPEIIEQRFARVFFESPKPTIALRTISEGIKTTTGTSSDLAAIIHRAELVSTASAIIDASSDAPPDYRSFFRDLARDGGVKEKIIAPIADAVLSIVPKQTRENIALSVMSSLWNKEAAVGGVVQKTLGALLESEGVSQLLQKWNEEVFSASGARLSSPGREFVGDVITTVLHRPAGSAKDVAARGTPTQSFVGNALTTVFHPKGFSRVWTEMVRIDKALLPKTAYQYYLSLSAKQIIGNKIQGAGYTYVWSFLAKRGLVKGASGVATQATKDAARLAAQKIGGKVITSTIGKSLGAFFGSFLGPGLGTFVGWLVGDMIIDKALALAGRAVSGAFNLLSLKPITDLMSGNIETTPLWEQEGAKWLIIGAGVFLFILLFPISLFGLTGSNYQKIVDDNTYIQAIGNGPGGPGGPALDCLGADKDKPECNLTACDPAVSPTGCQWPTSGIITQGPMSSSSCPGTHAGDQAIDIGVSGNPPVYATIDGTVTDSHWGCLTDSGCEGCTCANYVVITGANYTVGFWHLANIPLVQTGQTVSVGDVIGYADDTGNSSGPHLHYIVFSGGTINSILPVSVPTCNNRQSGCLCPPITTGGTP